jgi:RimJ/RimL family protein N-acetyltransferase
MVHVPGRSGPLRRDLELHPIIVRAKNGEDYTFRTIEPGDVASLMRGYDAMTDQAKWFRMLHTVPHLTEDMARRFCSPDRDRDLCVVIIGHGSLQGEILGGARVAGEADGRRAEFSVSLRPEAQGLGLAHHALHMVLQAAKEMGYERVWGVIATQNSAMLKLARRMGFTLAPDRDDVALIDAEIDIMSPSFREFPRSRVSFAQRSSIEQITAIDLAKLRGPKH